MHIGNQLLYKLSGTIGQSTGVPRADAPTPGDSCSIKMAFRSAFAGHLRLFLSERRTCRTLSTPVCRTSPDHAGENHLAFSVPFKLYLPNTCCVPCTAKHLKKISFHLYNDGDRRTVLESNYVTNRSNCSNYTSET